MLNQTKASCLPPGGGVLKRQDYEIKREKDKEIVND